MKKILIKLNVSVLVFCFVSNLFAGSIFLTPGGKAMAMGGAFVAVADDLTAIYWNPAGLTQQENSGAEFASFMVNYPGKSSKPLGNSATPGLTDFPIKQISPIEPAIFDSNKFDTNAFLPFIGGYKRLDETTVLGFGAYVSAGGGGKWESSVNVGQIEVRDINDNFIGILNSNTTGKIDAEYGIMLFNISGAKTLSDKLSLGLGLNFVYMQDQEKAVKSYSENPVGTYVSNYNIQVDQKATGYGYEATAGLLYKANDELNLGMVFRTGSTIKLDGTANYSQIGLGAMNGDGNYSTPYTENFRYPMTIGVGASYLMTEKLKLSTQVDYLDYSTMKKNYKYDNSLNSVFLDNDRNSGWEDTIMIGLGIEYKCTDNFSLLAGWQLEPSPSPQDKLKLLGTDQYSYNNACIGFQYVYGSIKFAFNYAKCYSKSISQDGISYDYDAETYRFNIGYSFK